jgi:hypothetical protein
MSLSRRPFNLFDELYFYLVRACFIAQNTARYVMGMDGVNDVNILDISSPRHPTSIHGDGGYAQRRQIVGLPGLAGISCLEFVRVLSRWILSQYLNLRLSALFTTLDIYLCGFFSGDVTMSCSDWDFVSSCEFV